jgi:hypothetical protein
LQVTTNSLRSMTGNPNAIYRVEEDKGEEQEQ